MASILTQSRSRAMRLWHLPAAALWALAAGGLAAMAAEEPPPQASSAPAAAPDATVPPAAPAAAATPAAPATEASAPKAAERSEFHGSFELDNQYSSGTDPLRATLALSYSNLFSKLDELAAAYQVAPQDARQVGIFAANYASHPLPEGLQPSVYFIDANTNEPTEESGGVLGKGQVLGFRLSHALGAASLATQSLTLALEYKHFRNTLPAEDGVLSMTPVSYLNLSLAYAGSWSNTHRDASLSVSANFGPHGGGNSENAYADGDFHARSDYFYVRADGAVLAALPKGLRLYLRAAGQYSARSLIIDEDYPVAGIDGVRGYLEAEVLGDRALKGTVQLQSPTWQRGTRQIGDGFFYFDAAVADMLQVLPGEMTHVHPRSWGFGVDVFPWKHFTGALVWARPLVNAYATQAGESRLLFLVRGSF
ncbi:MAG TPA: ShlB/FhaC/HecB family hemolysin secretion/activation protein [Steroidobacteraceae bacterium]|jgi:hemolysin activation/secretion protein|nr:ShlB/FhaC/HecB family hemolysin secretion/activation protein [Steroidobacteraceae bacterium]